MNGLQSIAQVTRHLITFRLPVLDCEFSIISVRTQTPCALLLAEDWLMLYCEGSLPQKTTQIFSVRDSQACSYKIIPRIVQCVTRMCFIDGFTPA